MLLGLLACAPEIPPGPEHTLERDGMTLEAHGASADVTAWDVPFAVRASAAGWWRDAPGGLEQGFVVDRPDRDGHVTVEVTFDGANVDVLDDGSAARVAVGGRTLWYRDLHAWDANGRVLASAMKPADGGVALRVDTERAVFPVTIDPVLTPYRQRLVGARLGDRLGNHVTGVGDVNGDGYDDLLVGWNNVGRGESGFHLYAGQPGTVDPSPVWSVSSANLGLGSSAAALGDYDGDGWADFAIGSPVEHTIDVYHGGPSGPTLFEEIVGSYGPVFGAAIAGVGDLNQDGFSDLVAGAPSNLTNTPGTVFVYNGHSGAPLPGPMPFDGDAGDRLGAVVAAAGDLDADGWLDFAATAPGNDKVAIWRGGPAGPTQIARFGATGDPTSLAGGTDMNGDGYADLLVSVAGAEAHLSRLMGGESGYSPGADWPYADVDSPHPVISLGDVNGDGFGDAAVGVRSVVGQVWPHYGGPFMNPPSEALLVGTDGQGIASSLGAVDLNSDGFPELIVGAAPEGAAAGAVYVYSGGPSQDPIDNIGGIGPGPTSEFGSSVSAADIDGDGDATALISSPGSDKAYLHGTLFAATAVYSAASSSFVSSAGDVNADGYEDVFFGTNEGAPTVELHLGRADDLLDPAVAWTPADADASMLASTAISVGDVDGDGFGDVAIGNGDFGSDGSGRVQVVRGTATGLSDTVFWSFTGSAGYRAGASLAAGDLNGDGRAELIVGAPGIGKVLFFTAVGGTFGDEPARYSGPAGTDFGTSVAFVGDVDCDGAGDAVGGGPHGAGAIVLYRGGVDAPQTLATTTVDGADDGLGASIAAGGDVDRDGCAEFFVGQPAAVDPLNHIGAYTQFRWTGDALSASQSFANPFTDIDIGVGTALAPGDLNGDGMIDLIVGRPGMGTGNVHYAMRNTREAGDYAAFPARARAQRADRSRILPGLSADSDTFHIVFEARGALGRRPVLMEVQIGKAGRTSFDPPQRSAVIVPPPLGTGELMGSVTVPQPGKAYHWRARLVYELHSAPVQSVGPWIDGGLVGDAYGPHVWTCVDTNGDQTCDPPPDCSGDPAADLDQDGICDADDFDKDGDNEIDTHDSDPDDPYACADTDGDNCDDCLSGTYDPVHDCDQLPDADGDGVPDVFEGTLDVDGDGTPNDQDADSDGDGIADGEDDDRDGDGTPNDLEIGSTWPDDIDGDGSTNDNDDDADGDGAADAEEGTGDRDDDGVPDWADPDPADDTADSGGDTLQTRPWWVTGGGCSTTGGGSVLLAALGLLLVRRARALGTPARPRGTPC